MHLLGGLFSPMLTVLLLATLIVAADMPIGSL